MMIDTDKTFVPNWFEKEHIEGFIERAITEDEWDNFLAKYSYALMDHTMLQVRFWVTDCFERKRSMKKAEALTSEMLGSLTWYVAVYNEDGSFEQQFEECEEVSREQLVDWDDEEEGKFYWETEDGDWGHAIMGGE